MKLFIVRSNEENHCESARDEGEDEQKCEIMNERYSVIAG